MPHLTLRCPDDLYHEIVTASHARDVSVSECVRLLCHEALHGSDTPSDSDTASHGTKQLVTHLEMQLQSKDAQIAELHQLLAMSQQNTQRLLDDKRRKWWKFWH